MLRYLDKDDRAALDCFCNGIKAGKTSIDIPFEASIDRIMFLYKMCFSLHPELVNVDNSHISVRQGIGKSTVKIRRKTAWNVLEGTHKDFGAEEVQYLKRFTADTVKKLGIENASELAKVVKIYDYLVTTVKYRDADCAHNAWGALIDRKAVCEGIAYAFCLLARSCGIEAIKISGFHNGGSHAWNMVKIYGKTYHLDATADLQDSEFNNSYNHLFLSDADMKNYTWDRNLYVPCTSTQHNYFILTDSFAKDKKDAIRIMKRQFSKGKIIYFRCHKAFCPDFDNISEMFKEVLNDSFNGAISWKTYIDDSMNIVKLEYDKKII